MADSNNNDSEASSSRYEIWDMRHKIDHDRTEKQRELMEEYDRTVYYPAKKKLHELCASRGHKQGKIHNNGLGWTFIYCSQCGTVMEKHGPED